ncbi:hypothetical protein VM1G_10064 [Cytospora mali]|uniref:HNH nuclease domain-containing protein n=1 Tax=Cytospora mali TaxID=578113 RepID=A0A194WE98_CYTMA|nr:hypothetical protein VM1G_10064 [Valsa mali]
MSLSKPQRAMSWNVEFFNFSLRVGGVCQRPPPDLPGLPGLLSVADIAHELNVCFVCDPPADNAASWAPALLLPSPSAKNLIILDQRNNDPFPMPTADVHSYQYVFHLDCAHPEDPHKINDTCIYRKPGMIKRRKDQRYIDIGSRSSDPNVADFPTRTSSRTRTSSLKRDSTHSSRSPSPSRTVASIPDELCFIPPDERREMTRIINQYATNVFQSCPRCVITGEGNYYGIQGPGLEAAHIVPQSQWNKYPIDEGIPESGNIELLKIAWRSTWDAQRNGIMLLSIVHRCFDARLIAIHPKTKLVRVFVNYDPLNKYHGKKVNLPRSVPVEVWQHHWDMCCLENTVGTSLPFPGSLTDIDIPELPKPKVQKLDHGDPTKQGSSFKATDSKATDTQATDIQATDIQASSVSIYHGSHPPSPPLSKRASVEREPWPFGKEILNDPDIVQQVIGEDKVLEEINIEDGRGRPRKRKQPGCTATEEYAEDRDSADGAKKQRLD